MPLPDKKLNEKLDDYLQRCVPVEVRAGKSTKQASAICAIKWKNS